MTGCRHKFIGSNRCALCGWQVDRPPMPAGSSAEAQEASQSCEDALLELERQGLVERVRLADDIAHAAQLTSKVADPIVHEASQTKHGETVCGLAFEQIRKGDKVVAGAVRREQVTCPTCIVVDELVAKGGGGPEGAVGENGPVGTDDGPPPQGPGTRERIERLKALVREGKCDPQLQRISAFLAGGFAAQAALDAELAKDRALHSALASGATVDELDAMDRRLNPDAERNRDPIDTINEFCVAGWGNETKGGITLLCPPLPRQPLTRAQALTLAAWLVAIAEETEGDFVRYLIAVQNT